MDNIFETHPNLKEYFKTSDGSAFYTEHDAANHAKTLENRKVEKVERVVKKAAEEAEKSEELHEEVTETKETKNTKKGK